MKRAQIDAFCGCRETLYQRIVFFAAPAILLAGIVYAVCAAPGGDTVAL